MADNNAGLGRFLWSVFYPGAVLILAVFLAALYMSEFFFEFSIVTNILLLTVMVGIPLSLAGSAAWELFNDFRQHHDTEELLSVYWNRLDDSDAPEMFRVEPRRDDHDTD